MKKLFVCMFVLTLACSTALFAAEVPRQAHATPSVIHTPAVIHPDGTKTIFSNLGPSTNAYYDGNGWLVAGPASELGESQWIGLPFIPAKNSTVTKIEVALSYDGAGANQAILSLNNDSSGSVGTVIEQKTVKNFPNIGTCCTLVTWKLKTPQAVTAGTQYWVVASTPTTGTGDDVLAAWMFSVNDWFDYNVAGGGWTGSLSFTGIPAAGVFGTIP